ncbi:sigma-54-dependent Fis family transcriptional regulator [Desulfolithobacter dissulfuricans]|uniref:Sigma-54-dependent Fis family transcriptional regulator n=1 Tax=Desulfolithobacter dissulfuricans TaxID=2795293 RepID=A0A915U0R4_9BACT|nr:sigma-54 dependent transcriptional regulator [Desulfolithobacter dissulfuricans]BCO08297.1 sigma-54-dependent Fis family transcriptional regulator [Desulfolithobacter dissulfuricans]
MKSPAILIIDDDQAMRELLRDSLAEESLAARLCGDSREAMELLGEQSFDLVITDLKMPHHNGLAILELARQKDPEAVVIMITGYGSVETAIEAIRKGAYDYIQKPFEPDDLLVVVRRALEHVALVRENRRLRRQVAATAAEELVGDCRPMRMLKQTIDRVAPFDTPILIEGETGTGKELVARRIHRLSRRASGPFVAVNCGALAEQLLESELFGHEKGSFTGADRRKKGLFEAADKGTIFLDEISNTSPNFQIKLLRVLQEGQISRVGSTTPISIDVRVLAATNIPLVRAIKEGIFRRDLMYRLNVITLELPPLRHRKDDILLLAHHFLARYTRQYDKAITSISDEIRHRLLTYHWPGNVRELENALERAVLLCESSTIQSVHLSEKQATSRDVESLCSNFVTLAEMEKMIIRHTLQAMNGHRELTAGTLGISTTTLWRKMKKYNLF